MLSAKGDGAMSKVEIQSGYVKFIHPDGYGFVVCDDSEIPDCYCHSDIVELYELEEGDDVGYSRRSDRRGKYAVDQIFSVNENEIEVKPRIDGKKMPGKVIGTVMSISNS